MNQQRIIFESSPGYIALCLIVAAVLAYLLYRAKHPWSEVWNKVLLACRFVLLFLLTFLLLGPIVKQIHNLFEKPVFVLVYDNSASVRHATDTTTRVELTRQMNNVSTALTEAGYDVRITNLQGEDVETPRFTMPSSDIAGA